MEGSLSHDEVDNLLMHLFGINHSLTRYLPHLMAVSGTKDCRFCWVSWDKWEINNPSMCEYQSRLAHVKQCAQTAAKGHVRAMVENALDTAFKESTNFAWIRRPPFGPCLVKDFTDASGAAHLYKHSQNQSVCRVGACSVSLQGLWDWRAHAWEKHQIPFEGIIEEFVQWCDWCEDCVIVVPSTKAEEPHFSIHIDHAFDSVKKYGYLSCHDGTRPLVPRRCVFCLHDRGLVSKDRLFLPTSRYNRLTHLLSHFNSKTTDGVGLPVKVHCPASEARGTEYMLCNYDGSMGITELRDHLEKIHGIKCPGDDYQAVSEKRQRHRKRQDPEKNLESSGTILVEKSTNAIAGQHSRQGKRRKVSTTLSEEMDDAVFIEERGSSLETAVRD
ncbi:hypothetical protein V1505DRAFT_362312 [Lipomyces doorenjongii]